MFGVDNNCQAPKIVPQGPLAIHPGATALQYAQVMFFKFQIKICYVSHSSFQSVFEGMKAVRGTDDKVTILFDIHHLSVEAKTI